ncbi:MAG: PLP-dependent aminotransferase family protein [Chloroflexota bacterium]|nr:PLP-dependent aminotransferase family protein [Chloroflexota bacterium]
MATDDWTGMLGAWAQGAGPMYRLLAEALQKAVLEGSIVAGTRLPAERTLARLLAISRTTVAGAYEMLHEEEWVERRVGSGTWVKPIVGARSWQRRDTFAATLKRNPLYDSLLGSNQPFIDFSKASGGDPAVVPYSTYALPEYEIAELLEQPGYVPLGLPALRRAIAARYSRRGLATGEEQILVTNGAQQAISLVAALYVQRGDTVLVENPTFVGAIDTLGAGGGRLVPVPIEGMRIRVDLLPGLARAHYPQLLYVSPTCQNPTGTIFTVTERREIVRFAAEHGIPVLEDNTLADLVITGEEPRPIAAYAEDGPVLSVGSMSKLFWAGLRIGWVRAPQPLIARLARLKLMADLGTGLISQAIAVRLLESTDVVRARRREELALALTRTSSALREHLPEWEWTAPSGGTFLWVRLPNTDAQEFAQMALRCGLVVTPGIAMSVDGSHTSYLRLPFFLNSGLFDEGFSRLIDAWAAFTRLAATERHMVNVVV